VVPGLVYFLLPTRPSQKKHILNPHRMTPHENSHHQLCCPRTDPIVDPWIPPIHNSTLNYSEPILKNYTSRDTVDICTVELFKSCTRTRPRTRFQEDTLTLCHRRTHVGKYGMDTPLDTGVTVIRRQTSCKSKGRIHGSIDYVFFCYSGRVLEKPDGGPRE
jgi:hypothetical protein